ncbi:BgTH12-05062 [Blumeria graminis f. sp. triticale]|uniref:BgTH12-05062 n=1 Tax=Blumeria graminis f. sp. triticale TaxID=1689686 RepID=A0A9W4D6Y4_BLUGR|nr:BgTH12-05062 [Blumeria graminis f. sp. triticale]
MKKLQENDIEELKAGLSNGARIVVQGDADYEQSLKRWSAAAEKRAAIIVFPNSPADVSLAVKFTQAHQLELAVKGGGHGTSGSSSTHGGLCIDLSQMSTVLVDPVKQTIHAGGGSLWKDVYAAGESHGLACVGGAVDDTGVGGLTLGGGYGYMSGARGLVIDNLISVEYVLANGNIVTASAHENPDLFWAARGAGAGFGIATAFVYQAYEQKAPVWGGLIIFEAAQLDAVIEAGNHFINTDDEKGSLVISITCPPPANAIVILALVYYNGPESDAQNTFASLLRLPAIANTTGFIPYPAINQLFSTGPAAQGMRHSMKGAAFMFPMAPSFTDLLLKKLSSFIQECPDAASSLIAFEFFPYRMITAVPQTATAFANRGAYGNLLTIMGWRDSANDTKCREWAREVSAMSKSEFMKQRAKLSDSTANVEDGVGEYFNYDGLGISGHEVFGGNFARLVALKKLYDPGNLFSKGPNLL